MRESKNVIFFLIPIKIIWKRDIKYIKISLLNIFELTKISFPLKTTDPRTKEVTNIPLPIKLQIEKEIPVASSEATKEEITSGAPLPKANKVAAAIFWLIWNISTIFDIEVLKKISAVEESRKNRMIKIIIIKREENKYEPFK